MSGINVTELTKTHIDQKWAAYNSTMASLFVERDKYPVDSRERETVTKRILALWLEEN